jgi:hypothetical protein
VSNGEPGVVAILEEVIKAIIGSHGIISKSFQSCKLHAQLKYAWNITLPCLCKSGKGNHHHPWAHLHCQVLKEHESQTFGKLVC